MIDKEIQRWVIHADLDAFFAAAEVLRRPELQGLPVVVGGSPEGRGVVAAASYPARVFGIRSAMSMAEAVRRCPDLVIVRGDFRYYRELSRQFVAMLETFSPLVEQVSIDEAYLDVSGSERLFGGAVEIGRTLKERVKRELGLTVSLGIASNKLVAKIASDLDKPDGMRVVEPGSEAATLAPLPIEALPGIGPRSAQQLRRFAITTLGELAAAPAATLQAALGNHGEHLRTRSLGIDKRPVVPEDQRPPRKSVGHERTFSRDLHHSDELQRQLFDLAAQTGEELRRRGLRGTTVSLKLRYSDFETITRQASLTVPTDSHQEIARLAIRLCEQALRGRRAPVRLLGVRMTGLVTGRQLSLFEDDEDRQRKLNVAVDRLAERGTGMRLVPARYMTPPDDDRIR